MKKIAILLLFIGLSGFADDIKSGVKIDIDGRVSGMTLKAVEQSGCLKGVYPGWLKGAEQQRYLIFTSSTLDSEWRNFKLSFTPETSGKVRVSLRGAYQDRKNKNLRYTEYRNLKLEGVKGKNWDFKAVNGKRFQDWNGQERCFVISNQGNYLQCHHDFYVYQYLNVIKGNNSGNYRIPGPGRKNRCQDAAGEKTGRIALRRRRGPPRVLLPPCTKAG